MKNKKKTDFSTPVEYKISSHNPKKALLILKRKSDKGETLPCPFCGTVHRHGTSDGHRVAHCATGSKEYVTAPDGTVLYRKDGYLLVNEKTSVKTKAENNEIKVPEKERVRIGLIQKEINALLYFADPNPYIFKIKNNSNKPKECSLLGYNKNIDKYNYGNAASINITSLMPETSYAQALREISGKKDTGVVILLQSKRINQILMPIKISSLSVRGMSISKTIPPKNYYSKYQNQKNDVLVPVTFQLNGETDLSFMLMSKTELFVSIFIFPEERIKKQFNLCRY